MWYDPILMLEVDILLWVQNMFEPIEPVLRVASTYCSSTLVNFHLLPLLMAFKCRWYVTMLLVNLSANFSINILKWVIAETRPYWWVKETFAYTDDFPVLFHSSLTCETTPGSPSGHAMFNAAFMYALIHELFRDQPGDERSPNVNSLKLSCWVVYPIYLTTIALSRMYYSCHFLHQLVLGVLLGILITRYLLRPNGLIEQTLKSNRKYLGIAVLVWIGVSVSVYLMHFAIGVDPMWSVHSAFKWCSDPLYVQPDSTTIYALIRDLGQLVGLLAATPFNDCLVRRLKIERTIPLTSLIVIVHHILSKHVPRNRGVAVFYSCTFLNSALLVFSLLKVVPMLGGQPVVQERNRDVHHTTTRIVRDHE